MTTKQDTSDSTTPLSLSLHVKITIAPSNLQPFLDALRPVYESVISEPENLFFEAYTSTTKDEQTGEELQLIKFVENWVGTPEWFMTVQMQKPYYKEYRETTVPMFVRPREHEFWSRLPGKEWVSVKPSMYSDL
ncbi:hypothetical protein GQ43DRAFT_441713 [Delitschia confertaspora ATCC 74209]|uniref:ABM domain-containing protein n=1 Tax=Delitschia confertaspora ATCC 74209 TaxID=1513339 RepID=A0A9P4MXW0_9PLEO|nr:hypothetical protein GQ43DRAFT_441713 [Delitschia confertaspora ATCC 74209]